MDLISQVKLCRLQAFCQRSSPPKFWRRSGASSVLCETFPPTRTSTHGRMAEAATRSSAGVRAGARQKLSSDPGHQSENYGAEHHWHADLGSSLRCRSLGRFHARSYRDTLCRQGLTTHEPSPDSWQPTAACHPGLRHGLHHSAAGWGRLDLGCGRSQTWDAASGWGQNHISGRQAQVSFGTASCKHLPDHPTTRDSVCASHIRQANSIDAFPLLRTLLFFGD